MFGFKKKKKDKYYLELEDVEDSQSAQASPKKETKEKDTSTTQTQASQEKSSSQKGKSPEKPQSAASPDATKELIVAAVNKKSETNGKAETPAQVNFATDYLMPQPKKTRRRPGANMSMFMDMARDMNTPKSS